MKPEIPPPVAQRERLRLRLEAEGETELAARLAKCGERMNLVCVDCGHVHETLVRCKLRWCPSCASSVAATRTARFRFAVRKFKWPLFLTLTQSNLITLEKTDVRALKAAIRRLRGRSFWKQKVRGGVQSIELTNIGNGWHLHVHLVIDCDWLSILSKPPRASNTAEEKAWKVLVAKSELQEAWRQCLRQELDPIIHVKRASGDIEMEVLKYTIEPDALEEFEGEVGPVIRAMEGSRLMGAFGSCYRLQAQIDAVEGKQQFTCPAGHVAWYPDEIIQRIIEHPRGMKPSGDAVRREAEEHAAAWAATQEAQRWQADMRKLQKELGLPAEAVMPASQSRQKKEKPLTEKQRIQRAATTEGRVYRGKSPGE